MKWQKQQLLVKLQNSLLILVFLEVFAFKVGNQLAKTALLAKKGQRYLGLEGQAGVNINKGIKTKLGFNTASKAELTKIQKLKAFDRLAP